MITAMHYFGMHYHGMHFHGLMASGLTAGSILFAVALFMLITSAMAVARWAHDRRGAPERLSEPR